MRALAKTIKNYQWNQGHLREYVKCFYTALNVLSPCKFSSQPSVGQNDGEAGSSQGPGFAGLPGGLNAPHQSLGLGNDSQQMWSELATFTEYWSYQLI